MMRTHYCGDVRESDLNQVVTLNGWVDRRRDHGGVIFVDLRDRTGIVQIVSDPERTPDTYTLAESLRNEYVIQVTGRVSQRPEDSLNDKLPTGLVEIYADQMVVLNEVHAQLPFQVSKADTDPVREELRLKYRYLDLRRDRMQNNLALRHQVVKSIRRFLEDEENFLEIETPVLTRSTPEGARDFLVPSRVNLSEWFALPQSPQLFKQLLMISGFDRYYQIARCFRDEDLRADRQPEFTQLDMEMSFMSQEEVMTLNETLMRHVFKTVKGIGLPDPFPRMTYKDAMEQYGTDRPDTRFAMKLVDVSDLFEGCGFKVFSSAIANGGSVKVLPVPGGDARISNERVKKGDIFKEATAAGARGLAFIRVRENGELVTIGAIKDNLTPEVTKELLERTQAKPGDLLLFGAGTNNIVHASLSRLRLYIGAEFELIDPDASSVLWVTEFPMFEYNEDEKRLEALHHPFTAPMLEDLDDLTTARSQAYDMVYNGLEIGGGSVRIHQKDIQANVFEAIGLSDEEAQDKFGFLLNAFNYGAPPHAGIAFGLDRLVMILAEEESIRDAIAFPKTQQARCLLTSAPSTVDDKQLKELEIVSTYEPEED